MANIQPESRLLDFRTAAFLALAPIVQGLAAVWVLSEAGSWLPFAGFMPIDLLPQTLCGSAVAVAALIAPLVCRDSAAWNPHRTIFAALWQTCVLGYALLVAARMTPLAADGIAAAAGVTGLSAAALLLLAQGFPRIYSGVAFLWLAGLPVFAYFLAEISLWAGQGEWETGTSDGVRSVVGALLNLSPGTAAVSALSGERADGGRFSALVFVCAAGVTALFSARRIWRRHAGEKSAAPAAAKHS